MHYVHVLQTGSPLEKETIAAFLAKPEARALCQDSDIRRKKGENVLTSEMMGKYTNPTKSCTF